MDDLRPMPDRPKQAGRFISKKSGMALVLKQVRNLMAVPFKNSLERLGERADGRPALSLVPKGVFFVDCLIFVRVKVEVRCEFVALGFDVVGNAHVGDSARESLLVSVGEFGGSMSGMRLW